MSTSTYFFVATIFSNLFCETIKEFDNDNQYRNDEVNGFLFLQDYHSNDRIKREEEKIWGPWGKWTPCSVTCGEGRTIKFRYCESESCGVGEKEAKIKPCKMKTCPKLKTGETVSKTAGVSFWFPW